MQSQHYFSTLARYNAWATERLLDAVAVLPEDDYRRDVGLFFKSIHGTLNHLLVGEHLLWFVRFAEDVSPRLALSDEAEADRSALDQRLRAGVLRWAPVITAWPATRFEETLDYTATNGQAISLPFATTLGHVFNHSTHHRGQITAALTALGQPCPELDFVAFLRMEQNK